MFEGWGGRIRIRDYWLPYLSAVVVVLTEIFCRVTYNAFQNLDTSVAKKVCGNFSESFPEQKVMTMTLTCPFPPAHPISIPREIIHLRNGFLQDNPHQVLNWTSKEDTRRFERTRASKTYGNSVSACPSSGRRSAIESEGIGCGFRS